MKKISLLITLFFGLNFSNTLQAQCVYGILDIPIIAAGTKLFVVQISSSGSNYEAQKFLGGKTVTVGNATLIFSYDCWYRGTIEFGGINYEVTGIRVKIPNEDAEKISTASNSDFPMGTNVIVRDMPNPSAFSDEPVSEFGFVVGADLIKDADGKYAGCIEDTGGGKICFTGKKVEVR